MWKGHTQCMLFFLPIYMMKIYNYLYRNIYGMTKDGMYGKCKIRFNKYYRK